MSPSPTATLAGFASALRFEDIPDPVVRKTEDLLVDWLGSAVAGHGARPVETITRFALQMLRDQLRLDHAIVIKSDGPIGMAGAGI